MRGRNGDGEEEREFILPGLLYADDLDLCGDLEEGLKAMVGCFVEVCPRRGLKVSAGTDEAEKHRRVASGRRVVGTIRSLVNGRGLQFEW